MNTKFGGFTIVSYQVEEIFFLEKLSYKFSKLLGKNIDESSVIGTIRDNYMKLIQSSPPIEYHDSIFIVAFYQALNSPIATQTNNESSPKWKDILVKLYYENKKIEGYSKERIEFEFIEIVAENMNETLQEWEEEENSN